MTVLCDICHCHWIQIMVAQTPLEASQGLVRHSPMAVGNPFPVIPMKIFKVFKLLPSETGFWEPLHVYKPINDHPEAEDVCTSVKREALANLRC
ncbi:hypothetical protein CY35_19G075500 [Sphagnum magellanicum]|nr:hypothetical protein CY35_19G075500 [Sphagnum magellanicum]